MRAIQSPEANWRAGNDLTAHFATTANSITRPRGTITAARFRCSFGAACSMYGAPNESALPNDFEAGVLAETVMGPLFLGGSVGDTGRDTWFFQLGHVF